MQWWADDPIVFVRDGDRECNRIRLLVAEKRAGCAVRVLGAREPEPEFLVQLNPESQYPFLVCKELACYGYALEALLHERYEQVSLLPTDVIERAQLRLLADQVRSWYPLPPLETRNKLAELSDAFDPQLVFFASKEISVLDLAIAPLLFDAPRVQFRFIQGAPFTGYARMIVSRPSFSVLQRPKLSHADMRAPPLASRLGAA